MSVSLKDIAQELGVSTAAASRALNDRPGVSDRLRMEVKQAAQRLGYSAVHSGSVSKRKATGAIAVLFGHVAGGIMQEIRQGIDETARVRGYPVLRWIIDPDREFDTEKKREEWIDHIIEHNDIAGIIACYLRVSDVHIAHLYEKKTPIVLLENHTDFGRCVTINQQRASYKAVIHLAESERKSIGCIMPSEDGGQIWAQRLDGYRQALKDKGCCYDPSRIVYADWVDIECGYRATRELLQNNDDINAILYGCDELAAGGYRAIRECGLTIPDDVAVIGCDDEPFARVLNPRLSSIHQPVRRMAAAGFGLLTDYIEADDHSARAIQLETELVLRASSSN